LGVDASRVRLLFNMVEDPSALRATFEPLLTFTLQRALAVADPACFMGQNEIYQRVRGTGSDLATLAGAVTDYKALIAQAQGTAAKLALAQTLATQRLARGVLPELDACFAALGLVHSKQLPSAPTALE
jgi:hypothetical protein